MSLTGNMFDEKQEEVFKLMKQLDAYQHTINRIDDYFEYTNESEKDREKIHELLDNLTLKLSTIK